MVEETEVTELENQAEETNPEEVIEKPEIDKKPWFQKRIDRFTAQNAQLARTNEQLLTELANLKSGKTEEGSKSNLSDAEFKILIEQKAAELIEVKEFNDKCNATYKDGNEEYEDFQEAVKSLGEAGMMTKPFLDLVTDLDDSHKILYYLGTNPEEAERIQSLPIAKQALALAKLENTVNKKSEPEKKPEKKKVSDAPPPIKTVTSNSGKGSAGYASKYYDNMPMEEFMEWDAKNSRKK